MRTCLYGHGLSFLRNGKDLLSSFHVFCSGGWGLIPASILTVVLMSAGCDPKAPPAEDLGTVLHQPPVVAGSEEPYEFPEDVARRVDEVEAKRAESKGSMGR